MLIKYVYSLGIKSDRGAVTQSHQNEIIVEVYGNPADNYGCPSHEQLWLGDTAFRSEFLKRHHSNEHLLKYNAVPADGSNAIFSVYESRVWV